MKDLLKDKTPLNEVTRWEILRRSQRESPLRFEKKKFYRAKDFNNVNFEKLFTDDEFVWESRVGDYIVTIAFDFNNAYYLPVSRFSLDDIKIEEEV